MWAATASLRPGGSTDGSAATTHPATDTADNASSTWITLRITTPNAKVEGPHVSGEWRRGCKMSQRPRRQSAYSFRPLPTFVRTHSVISCLSPKYQEALYPLRRQPYLSPSKY